MTILDSISKWASVRPAAPAYAFYGSKNDAAVHINFEELHSRARAIAAELIAATRPGDRVMIIAPSCIEYLVGFFGCLMSGRIAVTVGPPRRRDRADAQMERLRTVMADCEPALVLSTRSTIDHMGGGLASGQEFRGLAWLCVDEVDTAGAPTFNGGYSRPQDIAFLQYTSGSTRTPKGVMVSHANLTANLELCARVFRLGSESVLCGWLPLFHDMGLIGLALQAVHSGCPYHFTSPANFLASPLRWLKMLSDTRATCTGAPNFAFELCADRRAEATVDLDLSNLDMLFCGAEPIRTASLERFIQAYEPFGLSRRSIAPGFGLAEATLVVSLDTRQAGPRITQSPNPQHSTIVNCGAVQPEFRLAIVDPVSLAPVADGEIGEIWLAGTSVCGGYWNAPEATRAVFEAHLADGSGPWMRTGDLGFAVNAELCVTGRIKDLIIIAGENHLPQDIEATVLENFEQLEPDGACAFEVTRPRGTAVAIVVEIRRVARRADPAGLAIEIARTVAEIHGIPVADVLILPPRRLPRTTSGKLQRQACRAAYAADALPILAQLRRSGAEAVTAAASLPLANWLRRRVAELAAMPAAEVDLRDSPARYGLGSADVVSLAGELAERTGSDVSPTIFFENATLLEVLDSIGGRVEKIVTASPRPTDRESIAIVGIGCRFPGGDTPEAFFNSLLAGKSLIGATPPQRWPVGPEDPRTLHRAGYIAGDPYDFDPLFFGISPREARSMDPQQRLALETSWQAVEDAGQRPSQLAGLNVAVFMGASTQDYARILWSNRDYMDVHAATGASTALIANRLSYVFDFRGESATIDTACSSSLVAVARACRALQAGEADWALAGGVNLILSPDTTLAMAGLGALSPTGRCAPFLASANGYTRGEGAAVVVLKRLTDAVADGDRIWAVIRGIAVNNDGRSNGLTAPNGAAQESLYRQALADAGVAADQVGYVETHGTGTPLGDPIEAAGLGAVYGRARLERGGLLIGAVKASIGHLEAAAGIAGLVRTVLSLERGMLAPTPHADALSPHIPWDRNGLSLVVQPTALISPLAAVSSFGFGGVNAHVILEKAPAQTGADARLVFPQIVALTARNEEQLHGLAVEAAGRLRAGESPEALAQAARRRPRADFRAAVIACDSASAADALICLRAGEPHPGLVTPAIAREGAGVDRDRSTRPVVFVFPGQGGQWPGMGAELLRFPVFARGMEEADAAIQREAGFSVLDVLRARPDQFPAGSELIQPTLFALQVALARLFAVFNVMPTAVVGHSLGEVAAAHIAGALSIGEAARVVTQRSRLASRHRGAMLAIERPRSDVETLIRQLDLDVIVAVENAPDMVVASGLVEEVKVLADAVNRWGCKSQFIPVDFPAHTPLVGDAADELAQNLRGLEVQPPRLPIFTSTLGGPLGDLALDAAFWKENLQQPVQFAAAMTAVLEGGFETFVEIGAHAILGSAIESCARTINRSVAVAAPLRRNKPATETLPRALAELFCHGVATDFASITPAAPFKPLSGHAFYRSNLRLDPMASVSSGPTIVEETFDQAREPYLADHRVGGRPVTPAATLVERLWSAECNRRKHHESVAIEQLRFTGFTPVDEPVQLNWEAGEWRATQGSDGKPYVEAKSATMSSTLAEMRLTAGPARQNVARLTASDIYAGTSILSLSHGPAMRCLEQLEFGGGSGDALARATGESVGRVADPVLIDGALQALGLTALAGEKPDAPFVPASIDKAELVRPWPQCRAVRIVVERSVKASEISGDVSIYDSAGNALLARLTGCRLVPLSRSMSQPSIVPLKVIRFAHSIGEPDPEARRRWIILELGSSAASLVEALAPFANRVHVARPDEAFYPATWQDVSGICLLVDDLKAASSVEVVASVLSQIAAVAIAAESVSRVPLRVCLLTVGAFDAPTGSLAGASAWAAWRVLRHELPQVELLAIDMEGPHPFWKIAARRMASRLQERDLRCTASGLVSSPRLEPLAISGRLEATVRTDASYLVVGGTSGLGWRIARWLLDRQAGEVTVTGRTGVLANPEEAHDAVADGRLRVLAADAADPETTLEIWRTCVTRPRALKGVVAAAGILADRFMSNDKGVVTAPVLAPKLAPLDALATVNGLDTLDFLLVLSSTAATIGSPGQGNYAAANGAAERIAANLRARKVRAYSIAWGPWRDVGRATSQGAADRLARLGMHPIDRATGLATLSAVLANEPADVAALDFDADIWMKANSGAAGWTYLGATPSAPIQPTQLLADIRKTASPIRRRRIVAEAIEKEVRTVLALAAPAPRAIALRDLGLDSLMAVEVRNRLERIFGLRMPSTLAFDHPTIDAIATAIEAQLVPRETSAPNVSSLISCASGQQVKRAVSGEGG